MIGKTTIMGIIVYANGDEITQELCWSVIKGSSA